MGRGRMAWLLALGLAAALSVGPFAPGAGANGVYVSNQDAATVSPFAIAAGGLLTPLACNPATNCQTASGPNGLAVDPSGSRLYVADALADRISVFAIGAGGALTPLACPTNCAAPSGSVPIGVAVDPLDRYVYATAFGTDGIVGYQVTNDTNVVFGFDGCPISVCGAGDGPQGIAIDPAGAYVYVTDINANAVTPLQITAFGGIAGTLQSVSCSACQTGTNPQGIAITPDGGHLYVANHGSNSISVFSVGDGGQLTPVTCSPASSCQTAAAPKGLAIDPSGKHLYVAQIGGDSVAVFGIGATGQLTPIPCSPASNCQTASGPEGIAVDPSGRYLYVSDGGASMVSVFAIGLGGAISPLSCSPVSNCQTGTHPSTFSLAVSPDRGPTASFAAAANSAESPSSFNGAASSSPDYPIASYVWHFGDGQSQATATPSVQHTYASPGSYTVTLTVTDQANCSTTRIYTGQTASCNGSAKATTTHQISVGPAQRALAVGVSGTGSGAVTASGINCPGDCSESYPDGTIVTLTAAAASGSNFAGWGGDCSGTGNCQLTMSASHTVNATFNANPPPPEAPNSMIKKATINQKLRKATFRFGASGSVSGFQCELKRGNRRAKFTNCRSPRTYKSLRRGKYTFEVRAVGPGGRDPSPAKKRFTIR